MQGRVYQRMNFSHAAEMLHELATFTHVDDVERIFHANTQDDLQLLVAEYPSTLAQPLKSHRIV